MVPIATIRILPQENGWTNCKLYRKIVIKLFWLIASIDKFAKLYEKSIISGTIYKPSSVN
jgi:hypothetical protein